MPSCLCVCESVSLCVCQQKRILKDSSSRVAKAFKDVILNENNQQNHIGTFVYLIQVKAALFCRYFSYSVYWLHPFRNRMWQLWSAMQLILTFAKILAGDNVRRGTRGKYSMNTLQLSEHLVRDHNHNCSLLHMVVAYSSLHMVVRKMAWELPQLQNVYSCNVTTICSKY